MTGIPSTRTAVRRVWENRKPDYSEVTEKASADRILTELVCAALDILAYRQLDWAAAAIQLVSSDRTSYLRFDAADDRTADIAVVLSQALSAHAVDGNALGEIIGENPPWNTVRILVLASAEGVSVKRLDLDPAGRCAVSWHGPFDVQHFTDIAVGFALFITHIVANVFDDDDGQETFEESFDWVV